MKVNLIIADNFYDDPDAIRNFALSQDFAVRGNYPGLRTKPFLTDNHKAVINALVSHAAGGVTDWLLDANGDGYTGSFQICTSADRTWIHSDYNNMWAGVCYLTPDAPLSSGTALYRHKESQERFSINNVDHGEHARDYTKWEVVDRIGNIYNRLILYPGNLFHASLDYFGNDLYDGRLFQTFFFNTVY
jgi:Family of unknown function (DUF6445)